MSEGVPEFGEVAAAVAPGLLRTAWLLTGDRHTAEDLVQEALVGLFLALRKATPVEHPAAFARTVLVRTHLSQRRRRSRTERPTDVLELVDRVGATVRPHLMAEPSTDPAVVLSLRQAIAELGDRDQTIVVLRYYEDRTTAEIAGDLGISEAAARARLSRATARLRILLDPRDPHETREARRG